MDFELAEEHRIFRDSLRKFLEAEIRPLDDRWGDEEMTPERARELQKMLLPWGYLGEQRSDDPFINCIMTEELGRVFPSLAGIVGMTAGAGWAITRRAHPEVARRLGPPLLAGDLIGANAISEPNVGSDPSAIQCRAKLDGDHYVINGTKCWISNGHIADVAVLVAQTQPGARPGRHAPVRGRPSRRRPSKAATSRPSGSRLSRLRSFTSRTWPSLPHIGSTDGARRARRRPILRSPLPKCCS